MEEKFLKSGEAAELLHITEVTLRRWERSGKLVPHHKSESGYKYYTRQQIHDFNKVRHNELDENEIEKVPETPKQETMTGEDENSVQPNNTNEVENFSPVDVEENIGDYDNQLITIENRAVTAEYHYFSTAKVVKKLTEIGVNEMVRIPMGRAGYVTVTLISGDVENPKEEHPTLLDVALIEGVVSLKKAGNKVFSVSQLLRHLNGNSRNGCTDEKIVEVTKRLRKMMEWRIRIDARPEFQHYKNLSSDVVEKAVFEGHLLDIIYLETTNWRGEKNVLFGFPINDCFKMPEDKNVAVTHESYSEPIGKLTCFQTDLLDIKGVRKTHQNNLIANYLLQRIQGMKNKRNKKLGIDSILFETLQKDCRLENSSKQQMYSIRETIVKMLEHWKDKGHIKDYKLIKGKGGVYHSIEIELPEAKKKKNG